MAVEKKVSDDRPGAGWKQCPECKKWSKGTRLAKCANTKCGKDFPAPKPRGSQQAKSTKSAKIFVDAMSTLKDVKKFADSQGGAAKVLQTITTWELASKEWGGLDGLKEALEALQDWDK